MQQHAALNPMFQLVPTAYHARVVQCLKQQEPEVWQWGQHFYMSEDELQTVKSNLLRDTYRIDRDAHPDIFASVDQAKQCLGINHDVSLYQANGLTSNAALIFMPKELCVLLSGPIIEQLSSSELTAVIGHEMAHHVLWSMDQGQYLNVDRLLNDAIHQTYKNQSLIETHRRYRLYTELFADRGSAIVCGSIEPVLSALLKIHMGLKQVNSDAYLKQIAELEQLDDSASTEWSHPEMFIRAKALSLWWKQDPSADEWIAQRLVGTLKLQQLDLVDQYDLTERSKAFVTFFIQPDLQSDLINAQVKVMFPDGVNSIYESSDVASWLATPLDASIKQYLCALMLDLSLVDEDMQEVALNKAGKIATDMNHQDEFVAQLARDAKYNKRETDRYKRQLNKQLQK